MAGASTSLLTSRRRRHFNPNHTSAAQLVVPISYQISLHVNNSGLSAGVPNTGSEVATVDTNYARQIISFDDNMQNAANVVWGDPGPVSWGTVTHTAIWAEVSAGVFECWWYGQIRDPVTNAVTTLNVAAGGPPVWLQTGAVVLEL